MLDKLKEWSGGLNIVATIVLAAVVLSFNVGKMNQRQIDDSGHLDSRVSRLDQEVDSIESDIASIKSDNQGTREFLIEFKSSVQKDLEWIKRELKGNSSTPSRDR